MNRRELILLLGGAVTAARALRAQQKAKPVIGILRSGSRDPNSPFAAAFREGLSEIGYVEGQNWRSSTTRWRAMMGCRRCPLIWSAVEST